MKIKVWLEATADCLSAGSVCGGKRQSARSERQWETRLAHLIDKMRKASIVNGFEARNLEARKSLLHTRLDSAQDARLRCLKVHASSSVGQILVEQMAYLGRFL